MSRALTWADYLVIGGYLLAITAFGSWFARFQKTTRDYFLTDRSVPWWAVCFTVVATETSTLTFIGIPAAAYAGNMTFLQLALGYVIGRIIVSLLFIPAYFRGDLFTSYELLQRRFGTRVKTLSAVIFLITRSLADGIRLFATALVIAVVTSVPVPWVVIVLGAAMIVYTVRGGVSAVIWTDVVQMFVYIAGAGGGGRVAAESHPRRLGGSRRARAGPPASSSCSTRRSISSRAYTFWAGVLGGVALTLSTHGTDQFLVQRLLSARSAREASRGLDPQRLHRLRAVRRLSADRRHAVRLLPAHAAAAAARRAPTRSCRSSSSARSPTASPASSSRRSWPRRCRRRSTRWPRRP